MNKKEQQLALQARREYQKQWREKNAEKIRDYHREWRKNNPEKVKAAQDRYWLNKAQHGTPRHREVLWTTKGPRCGSLHGGHTR